MPTTRSDMNHLQTRLTLWHAFALAPGGVTLNTVINNNQLFGHYAQQASALVSDYFYHIVWLKKGQYSYRGLWVRELNQAIIDITLEQPGRGVITSIATGLDMHGSFLLNQFYTVSFSVPRPGKYWLVKSVVGKSATPGGYRVNWTLDELFLE